MPLVRNKSNAFVRRHGMVETASVWLVGEWPRKNMKGDGVMLVIDVVALTNMKATTATKLSDAKTMAKLLMGGNFFKHQSCR
ncbi:unnamed protein product [Gongylonema pulchrum]|uniref:Uncharacterized protein n=1 Tax=Gongylonema pulchrum TaxID=637853 RepID=A0A3P6RSD8_9BILA|nr:unnamed protein product [Gongylonema pulchrum]